MKRAKRQNRFARYVDGFDRHEPDDDTAHPLKRTLVNRQGLWMQLSSRGINDWLVLDEIKRGEEYPNVGLTLGVETVAPGTYESACGKGYWECASDEPVVTELGTIALRYFNFRSESSILPLEPETGAFIRTWASDKRCYLTAGSGRQRSVATKAN